MNYKELRVE